jgi:hypothetical protein
MWQSLRRIAAMQPSGPQTLLGITGSGRFFKPPKPTHYPHHPPKERRKILYVNVKPAYTRDKLINPSPTEWTGLLYNDRKRA